MKDPTAERMYRKKTKSSAMRRRMIRTLNRYVRGRPEVSDFNEFYKKLKEKKQIQSAVADLVKEVEQALDVSTHPRRDEIKTRFRSFTSKIR